METKEEKEEKDYKKMWKDFMEFGVKELESEEEQKQMQADALFRARMMERFKDPLWEWAEAYEKKLKK